ncbi:hypothetical protein EV361DRAFT_981170 [Lentinula raphanica]|nr:hypothetical protein EV361DRAFT_981170 [Lentinula raphanica]
MTTPPNNDHPPRSSDMDFTSIISSSQLIYDSQGRAYRAVPTDVLENAQIAYPTPTSFIPTARAQTAPLQSSVSFPPAGHPMLNATSFPSFPSGLPSLDRLVSLGSFFSTNTDRQNFARHHTPFVLPGPPPVPAQSLVNEPTLHRPTLNHIMSPSLEQASFNADSQLSHVNNTVQFLEYSPTPSNNVFPRHYYNTSSTIREDSDPSYGMVPIPEVNEHRSPQINHRDLPPDMNQPTDAFNNHPIVHPSTVHLPNHQPAPVLATPVPVVTQIPIVDSVPLQSLLTSIKAVAPLQDSAGWKTWDTAIRNALILGNLISHILNIMPAPNQIQTVYNTPSFCPRPSSYPPNPHEVEAEQRWRAQDLTAVSVITFRLSETAQRILPPNPNLHSGQPYTAREVYNALARHFSLLQNSTGLANMEAELFTTGINDNDVLTFVTKWKSTVLDLLNAGHFVNFTTYITIFTNFLPRGDVYSDIVSRARNHINYPHTHPNDPINYNFFLTLADEVLCAHPADTVKLL